MKSVIKSIIAVTAGVNYVSAQTSICAKLGTIENGNFVDVSASTTHDNVAFLNNVDKVGGK